MALVVKSDRKSNKPIDQLNEKVVLDQNSTGGSRLAVKKTFLPKGSNIEIENSRTQIRSFQILSGRGYCENMTISDNHIVFVPANKKTKFEAVEETILLSTVVYEFENYENFKSDIENSVRIINWFDEPVMHSEHDFRKRIYIATKNLWGTDAIKGEIIIYPPNTKAPPHYHVGAEHFQYILSGRGLAILNDEEIEVSAGDLIYNYEREIHSFQNKDKERFMFVEYFVPGDCETIWTTTEKVCTWVPTNKNLKGSNAVRFIPKHVHGEKIEI